MFQLLNIDTDLLLFLSFLLSFIASLVIGPKLIAVLTAMKAGQPIRTASQCANAPEHQAKVGTPTMGGVMIMGLIILSILLFTDLTSPLVHCCLIVLAVTVTLGFLDDYAKITKKSSDGVSGWFKIGLQALAATAVAFYSYYQIPTASELIIPFYGIVDIGLVYIPLAIIAIIGTSNAVNLTDGLDGLASGCMMIIALFFLSISLNTSGAIILVSIFSACLGFLWFNCNPAKIFMGDTGSLALGGLLGTYATCTGNALVLVIAGAVFVSEAVSVMLQVGYFKYTRKKYGEGKRLFLMAPLHHHFEKLGWKETQVCVRFWIIAFLCACVAFVGYICAIFTTDIVPNTL